MNKTLKIFSALLVLVIVGAGAAGGGAWYWAKKQAVPMKAERVDYVVPAGAGPRAIALGMQQAGIDIHADAFVWMARLSKLDTTLQAGAYEAVRGDTPWMLMERMSSGNMLQTRLTIPEGWTYKRIREALAANEKVAQTLAQTTDQELLERLGAQQTHPEGLFYPDTYVFVPGTADLDILRRGFQTQQELLEQLWADRDPDLPLKTPYEALILASIVERETGHSQDRARVAGVFINRLRVGMPLQTDPTVIYGMGDAYDGRIRKRDLTTDTPWNTYTRNGLPPTPIASPGKASLLATLHPEKHDFYYFVSRGDGTSEFSANLAAHNRAVAKYILNR
ncbi:MAG TPA: endolytic transglycosylase MltG [Alcaligenes sp.]|nr:endolytic transglycosylase MltG [Alcaligenes sp.]HRL26808.1 endolytic transglycosylase MltG [Alcaligenes sp.]